MPISTLFKAWQGLGVGCGSYLDTGHTGTEHVGAYQRGRVLVPVQRGHSQTQQFHRHHMSSLGCHDPLQKRHELVGIETLISGYGEVGGEHQGP